MRPQHFQQQDRWVEALVHARVAGLRNDAWGIAHLRLDPALLAVGKVALAEIRAVMPDGTVISAPNEMPAPPPRDITPDVRDRVVKLAIPVRLRDSLEVAPPNDPAHKARHHAVEVQARDSSSGTGAPVAVRIAQLRCSLLLDGESEDDLVCLPICRVRQVESTGAISLAESFMPPLLDAHVSARLIEMVREIEGLLRSRGEVLASRVDPTRGGGELAGFLDLLMLQLANRYEPVFGHFARTPGLHPEVIYRAALQLAGDLSTFNSQRRRPVDFPVYRHGDLEQTFAPVHASIRDGLTTVIEQSAVPIELQKRNYGVWVAPITDRTLLGGRLVLVASASVPSEVLRSRFPTQVKLGPVESIRELVNLQLPGILLKPMPVAPREVPYQSGASYFELDQASDLWKKLQTSAAFAFHVSGDYPDLRLEFWGVRDRKT